MRRVMSKHSVAVAAASVLLVAGLVVPATGAAGAEPARSTQQTPAQRSLGIYPSYADVAAFQQVESDLGRELRYVVQFGDTTSGDALRSSVHGELIDAGGFQTLAHRVRLVMSVPLTFGRPVNATTLDGQGIARTNLQTTLSGAFDDDYRYVASTLVESGYPNAIIRIGWEFDVGSMPWSANGNCGLYSAAYRHVHDVFRSVSKKFRYDWTGTSLFFPTLADCAYPGNSYVDIVGLDMYDQSFDAPTDPDTLRWVNPTLVFKQSVLPLLEFQRTFARAHGKQVSYPEWSLSGGGEQEGVRHGGDNPVFIKGMYAWMNSLPKKGRGSLAYNAYFNVDTTSDGPHRLEAFPESWHVFAELFGGPPVRTTAPA